MPSSAHPRDKWTIATKLSNFKKESWGREESMKIYRESFEKLQVDTIDYYLLHAAALDYILGLDDRYHWDFIQIQMNYLDWNHAVRNDPDACNASYQYEKIAEIGIPVVIMELTPSTRAFAAAIFLSTTAPWILRGRRTSA